MTKRIIHIVIGTYNEFLLYKDPGMFPYALAKYCGWDATFAVCGKVGKQDTFEKYCKIISMGEVSANADRKEFLKIIRKFIKENIKNYDVVMLFNYGSTNYKLAYHCKKYNPNVKIWCKLDMSESGFLHFFEDGLVRKAKNHFERLKAYYVDLFTVETKYFYHHLKNTAMFNGGALQYLTNGVSLIDIDINELDEIKKENIVITVGRLGTYEKNNELFLEAIARLDEQVIKNKNWKFYFVGPMKENFQSYVERYFKENERLKKYIVFTGAVYDRKKLYRLLAKSKILCMTSRTEGFPLAVLEGIFLGCFPVLTNYGHSALDGTDNEKMGCIVANGDVDGLSKALEYYLQDDKQFEVLCPQCKKFAREQFGYENLSKAVDGYLQKIL